MRQKFARFMYGRNGPDALFRFTSYLAIIVLVVCMFLGAGSREIGFGLALALMVYTYFRFLSKNLEARRKENASYMIQSQRVKGWFKLRRDMWKQRKEYKFFKCPSCKTVLRVPAGKGKIRVLCRKCGAAFEKKT